MYRFLKLDIHWPKLTMSYTKNRAVRTSGVSFNLMPNTLYNDQVKFHSGYIVAIKPINSQNNVSRIADIEIPADKIPEIVEVLTKLHEEAQQANMEVNSI